MHHIAVIGMGCGAVRITAPSIHVTAFFSLIMESSPTDAFWENLKTVPTELREADVEHDLLLPLLVALGHDRGDIRPKVPVTLARGSRKSTGRRPEADYVVYSGPLHDVSTSLMVIEAKGPRKNLADARGQAESYALAVKARIFMLTNGQELQIWQVQPTLKVELVFESSLSGLHGRRGELEQLVSKRALIEHLRIHSDKTLAAIVKLHRYEQAEMARISKLGRMVARTLEARAKVEIDSTALMARYSSGALILAPSGYGKTILCADLVAQALRDRADAENSRIAIEILLPDFVSGQVPLLSYAHSRVVPHHPELGLSAFSHWIHEEGVVLCFDAYERVPVSVRPRVDAEIRTLVRDHPRSQVFVFSRGSALPALDLEQLQLLPLSGAQRSDLASDPNSHVSLLAYAPRLLWKLSEIPLLMKLVLEFRRETGAFPTRIAELFEHWLRRMMAVAPAPASQQVHQRRALELILAASAAGPVSPAEALAVIADAGLREETYDQLVECGVLIVTAASVEPVHEGLADYVRAQVLARLDDGQLAVRLHAWQADPDSLLPVLLAAMVRTPAARQVVWERLATLTLPRYLDAVRFAETIDGPADRPMTADEVRILLLELFDGVANTAAGFFPTIKERIYARIAQGIDEAVGNIHLEGSVDYQKQNVLRISFRRALPSHACSVEVRQPDPQGPRRSFSLSGLGLGAGAGRYLGVAIVRDAVLDVVDRRAFAGGICLANERAICRLRYMQRAFREDVDLAAPLASIHERYAAVGDKVVLGQHASSSSFPMSSLLADIELLIASGRRTLDCWWLPYGSTDHEIASSQERMAGFLRAFYQRATDLYREIVEHSFPGLAVLMPHHAAMPIRWDLQISAGRVGPCLHWRWFPVESEDQAVVTCRFSNEGRLAAEADPYDDELERALKALGRYRGRFDVEGHGLFPSMSPTSRVGRIDGETPAMRKAGAWVRAEIVDLFGELPQQVSARIGPIADF